MTTEDLKRDLRRLLPFAIIALTLYMQWRPQDFPYLLAYVIYSAGRIAGDIPVILIPFIGYGIYARLRKKPFPILLVLACSLLFSEIVNELLEIVLKPDGNSP